MFVGLSCQEPGTVHDVRPSTFAPSFMDAALISSHLPSDGIDYAEVTGMPLAALWEVWLGHHGVWERDAQGHSFRNSVILDEVGCEAYILDLPSR